MNKDHTMRGEPLSPTIMDMRKALALAAEVPELRREIDVLRSKLLLSDELARHYRRQLIERGIIHETA